MGLIEDAQTMWNIGEKLKKRGFKETLCVEFFGSLTHEENKKLGIGISRGWRLRIFRMN